MLSRRQSFTIPRPEFGPTPAASIGAAPAIPRPCSTMARCWLQAGPRSLVSSAARNCTIRELLAGTTISGRGAISAQSGQAKFNFRAQLFPITPGEPSPIVIRRQPF